LQSSLQRMPARRRGQQIRSPNGTHHNAARAASNLRIDGLFHTWDIGPLRPRTQEMQQAG
jgi:hypothetical protein